MLSVILWLFYGRNQKCFKSAGNKTHGGKPRSTVREAGLVLLSRFSERHFWVQSQTSTLISLPHEQMGFICRLLGVLPSNHSRCFPSAPISCKQRGKKQLCKELMCLKWSISCNSESADGAAQTLMTKLLVHIKFVCRINQTLMHERSEGARTTKPLSEERIRGRLRLYFCLTRK